MAKNKTATLEQVANEMNDVMAYGCDENGKLVDESEQIDVELSDKALLKVIKDRAKEDLRAEDEGSFSPEVWDWFIDNNLAPEPSKDSSENDPDAEDEDGESSDDGSEDDDAADTDEDKKPAPKQASGKTSGKGKANTPEKPQKGDSKAQKPKTQATTGGEKKAAEKGKERPDNPDSTKKPKPARSAVGGAMAKGGNENYAVSLVEDGATWKEFHAAFEKVYKENKPGSGADYILARAKIYWNIAHKKLGKETPPAANPPAGKPKEEESKKGGRRK